MPPLSATEHFILGAELKQIDNKLAHLFCDLANKKRIGAKTYTRGQAVRRAKAARKRLLSLRSALDSIACRSFPDAGPPSSAYFR